MRKFYLLIGLVFLAGTMFSQSFINYTRESTSGNLPDDFIYALAADSKGNIWIGTSEGLTKFDGVNWTTYTTESGLIDNNVNVIKEDKQGNLWVAAADVDKEYGGVSRFDGQHWNNYDTQDGLISNYVRAITYDTSGNLYFGSSCTWYDMIFLSWYGGVTKFDGINWTTLVKKSRYDYSGLAIDDQGTLWTGNSYVLDILVDTLWPFCYVQKINNTDTTVYTSADGLSGTWISSIVIDSLGNKWVTTNNGVSMFDGTNWSTYTTKDGLAGNLVFAMAIDSLGNKWFGTSSGVSKFDGANWTNFSTQDGLLDNNVTEIAIDSKGNKWFGTYSGVSELVESDVTVLNSVKNTYDAKIYPDPVIDKMNIILSKPVAQGSIALFNLNGVQLCSATINSKNNEVDMSQLSSGIYFVKIIISGECVLAKQIVKL